MNTSSRHNLFLIFGLEGILYQFSQSVNGFSNALYATNLGATDTQIGLIQTVPNLLALLLMLPCGILSDRLRRSRTVPVACLLLMGVMYFLYGSVPLFGQLRMSLYFVFLGMTVASAVLYNAQWQSFFGDVCPVEDRSDVLTFRTRIMSLLGVVIPLLCGFCMARQADTAGKLLVLRVFYYLCGALVLLQALTLRRIPCPERSAPTEPFRPAAVVEACRTAFASRPFRRFFLTGVLFYLAWHPDWSVWYLEQTQYAHMTEAHLSIAGAVSSVVQIASLGYFSRLSKQRSVYFTMILAQLGYVISIPLAVLSMSPLFSVEARPWAMILTSIPAAVLQCSFNLNLVQMMLMTTPQRGRSLIVSLYTLVITLSNAVMPLLGIQLYTALGANWRAVVQFDTILLLIRLVALAEIVWLYVTTKREGMLFAKAE